MTYNEATALLVKGNYGPALALVPEVTDLKHVDQSPGNHPEGNAFVHTILALSYLPPNSDPALAWAVLLHDIGKISTAVRGDDGIIRFPNHHKDGGNMVRNLGPRIGMPPEMIERVSWLVYHHMHLTDVKQWKATTFARFFAKPDAMLLLELFRIDILASHKNLDMWEYCRSRITEIEETPVLVQHVLNGKDLKFMGYPPGRNFRHMLDALDRSGIKDPEEAKEFIKKRFPLT